MQKNIGKCSIPYDIMESIISNSNNKKTNISALSAIIAILFMPSLNLWQSVFAL